MTHNKNSIPLLYLLINYMSGRCAPQILSLKEEYNLLFLKLLLFVQFFSQRLI